MPNEAEGPFQGSRGRLDNNSDALYSTFPKGREEKKVPRRNTRASSPPGRAERGSLECRGIFTTSDWLKRSLRGFTEPREAEGHWGEAENGKTRAGIEVLNHIPHKHFQLL